MTSTCHCGAIRITITKRPDFMNDCNCSFCRKSGAVWGYFMPDDVDIVGPTDGIERDDKPMAAVAIHSCNRCHTTTHFQLTDAFKQNNPSSTQIGVNMRLFDPSDLEGIEVKFPNGDGWNGELPYGFRRDGFVITENQPL